MRDTKETVLASVILAVTVAVFLAVGYGWQTYACSARWSGFQTEFGIASGCRVADAQGRFVPERAARGLP